MTSLFLNPYTMLAGAALVSSPIIIHLLNRMRIRRVPWAAMEFLLKAQKKNQRRRIIEQLILLLLRVLLVLLIGLLLARFISDALAFAQPQETLHVVVLDDSASMGDRWRLDGETRRTHEIAAQVIVNEIARGAVQARTPQALEVLLLSELDAPIRIERLNNESIEELRARLADVRPTALHLSPIAGVRKARERFDRSQNARRVLHLVSDFRQNDWSGGLADELHREIESLTQARGAAAVAVHLLDVADPVRSPTQNEIRGHENIGFVDLQPVTRLAARHMPVEFTATVANFSPAARRNLRIIVRVNGQPREDASFTIVDVKPGLNSATFMANFDQLGPNQVSTTFQVEDTGLTVDNTRYSTIEVRERVPILFVEGDLASRGKAESDAYFLRALFADSARGFDIVERAAVELEQPNLDKYSCIFVLNVPRLNDKALANLESYVRAGGGVFFALGDAVDADFYNRKLYAEGRGLFPCPIETKPTPRPTDAQRLERISDPAMPLKLFARSDNHPIFTRLYRDDKMRESNTYLRFLSVDQYFPVPRQQWNVAPVSVDELLTLPNTRAMDDYKEVTQKLLNQLPVDDPRFPAYRLTLREQQRRLKSVLATGTQLHQLAAAIETMLNDPGKPGDAERADLRAFWQEPAVADLATSFHRLLESVRFGDPLLVARRYGRGPVLAYLSSAGSAWNDFANGPARPFYVMLMIELQKYLSGGEADVNRFVGAPFELPVDPNRFGGTMRRFYVPDALPDADQKSANVRDLGEQQASAVDGVSRFIFAENRTPGLYRFEFKSPADGRVEQISTAFNVDTAAEGDLRRVSRADLLAAAPGALLHSPGSGLAELLRDRRSDLSESPWLFLVLLIVLVAEQAMAVRLSYHSQPNLAAGTLAQSARARMPTEARSSP